MNLEETITIPKSRYRELLYDAYYFMALESGGVDNWTWYSDSINDFVQDSIEQYKKNEDFRSWVNNVKSSNETYEEFIEDMGIHECVDYELSDI